VGLASNGVGGGTGASEDRGIGGRAVRKGISGGGGGGREN